MTRLSPWSPWGPLEEHEADLVQLGADLSQLADHYMDVPELAALAIRADGTERPYVTDRTGHPHPLVLLVGEAPGGDEDREGEPFVGRAGRFLDRELERAGIGRRDDCYATNSLKHRPVDERDRNRRPTDREVELSRPFLLREIELIDPLIVVTLGGVGTSVVWPEAPSITVCQGELRELPTGHSHLPVVHPSFAMRDEYGAPGQMFRHGVRRLGELVAGTRMDAAS